MNNQIQHSKNLQKELEKNESLEINTIYTNDNELIDEYLFYSNLTSPLSFLQSLCDKYDIDIIGVAYDFTNGYVESFEFKYKLNEEEINYINEIELISNNEEIEVIDKLPKYQDNDDSILDDECPKITDDDFDIEKIFNEIN